MIPSSAVLDAETTRVLVVARNPLARIGLGALLARQSSCTVVGEVAGDNALPEDIRAFRPEVILWDLDWESTALPFETLGENAPPIVALLPDASYAAQAWAGGALGLLLRHADGETLAAAATTVARGLSVFDPILAQSLFPAPVPAPQEALTTREVEVLQLLAQGLPNKAIATKLEISEHTVKFHVNAIMTKLGVQSRTEAVIRAVRLGLVIL